MKLSKLLVLIGVCTLLVSAIRTGEAKPTFRPVPEGVVELTGLDGRGGIVELKDGSLMLAHGDNYRISQDGGETWGDDQPLNAETGADGIIRFQSGTLAIYGKKGDRWYFSSSPDEGKTWTAPVLITNYPDYHPMNHSMIQLKSGRLLLVGYWCGLNPAAPDAKRYSWTGWGWWRGATLFMDGHRGPEMGIGLAYYSDDEGQTWQRCGGEPMGGLFGWFDERGVPNGEGGATGIYEPTAAETKDGRVLLFARSKVGRLVQSYSLNDGDVWHSILPTELSSSQAPPLLIQIPQTGDLLCVWNQVSTEEILRGFARGRLSAAISKDSGMSWENFKALELQEGMKDVTYIDPEFPIPRIVVGRPGLGQLPDGFAQFSYPNVDIVGDKVFIRYSRSWPKMREVESETPDKAEGLSGVYLRPDLKVRYEAWPAFSERGADMTGERVLRIYPLEWFYK